MKTRLLALVLACLMVLSVMPVVVFAEDFCELSSQVDGDHTLATCPDGEYIKTVPPQCGDRWGYDLFKCPGCSEFFADNFVRPVYDAHTLEQVAVGVAQTCTTEGRSAAYKCLNCPYEEGGEILPALGHDMQPDGEVVGDCTGSVQTLLKCTRCGELGTDGQKYDEHDWVAPPTIELETQKDADGNLVAIGWGTYTCSRCPVTKKVIVLHDCTLVKVPAKDATCVADGNNEYWQCTNSDCGKRFATNDATGTVLTDENIVIPVGTNGGHDLKKVDAKAATCNKDQTVNPGNIEYYDCKLCGRNFADANATTELPDEQVIDDDHAWRKDASGNNEDGWVPPTCTEWGGYRYICGRCGAIKNNAPVEPLGHTGYDEKDEAGNYVSTNRKEIWTSCQEGGTRTWDCGRCGEPQEEPVAAHKLYEAEFPATCTHYYYHFWYCIDETCNAGTKPATDTHTTNGKAVEYDLKAPKIDPATGRVVLKADGKTPELELYVVVGEIKYGTTLDPKNHNYTIEETNPAGCLNDGDYARVCYACNTDFEPYKVEAYHKHPQGDPIAEVAATCTTPAYKTYNCAHCQGTYDIVEGSALGHKKDETTRTEVLPTCSADGYYIYECERHDDCGYVFPPVPSGKAKIEYVLGTFYTEIEGDTTYAQIEKYADIFVGYYKDAHPNAVKEKVHIQGNCTMLGLYRYWCADCENYLLVAMPGTGLGHQNDGIYNEAGEVAPVEATCTTNGSKGTYKCTVCGELVAIEPENLNKLGHNVVKVDVDTLPAGKCKLDYWTCTRCGLKFTDADGKNVVADFADHNPTALDGRDLTCTKFSYQHYECGNCGVEYINNYFEAPGHNWGNKTPGKAPTCVEDGYKDLWICDRTICDEAATGGCVHPENDGSKLLATGIHKNSDGREFTDKCTDTETNRVCVVCKDYIERIHHYADPVYVDATCVDYGYNLYICVDCHDDYVEKVAEKTGHNWGEWKPVAGNPNMEERFCQTERCNAREEKRVADVEYFMEVENVLGDVGYTDSSLIAVTVKIKADAPVWGVRFNVNYDENLTFVRAENVSNKLDCGSDFHDNGKGVITMAADASNSDEKERVNAIIEGKEDLFVLYFRITLPLDATTGLPVVGHEKTESVLTITPVDAINAADEDLEDVYHGDLVNGVYTDSTKIEILPFMNFNLDCCINMKDLARLYDLSIAADGVVAYDVTLDINQDGAIEYDDYVALYRFLVHAWNYKHMTQIGVPAEELA